jgi:hypothetical protein
MHSADPREKPTDHQRGLLAEAIKDKQSALAGWGREIPALAF